MSDASLPPWYQIWFWGKPTLFWTVSLRKVFLGVALLSGVDDTLKRQLSALGSTFSRAGFYSKRNMACVCRMQNLEEVLPLISSASTASSHSPLLPCAAPFCALGMLGTGGINSAAGPARLRGGRKERAQGTEADQLLEERNK